MNRRREAAMTFRNSRYVLVFVLPVILLLLGLAVGADQPPSRDGKLIVKITSGDLDNTPAKNAHVEVYAFVSKYDSFKSFVLKMSHDGEYEISLPRGHYDVFL